jgi:DedD protein
MTKDSKLRQRLVGGVVLLSIALILLPALVDYQREPDRVADPVKAPPAPPYRDYQSRVVPIEISLPTTDPGNQGVISRTLIDQPARAVSEDTPVSTPPVARTPVALARKDEDSVTEPVRSLNKGWVVQVATFSNSSSAEKVRSQLADMGFVVFVEPVKTPAGNMSRVRIGPEIDRERAEANQAKLQANTEYAGIILRFP